MCNGRIMLLLSHVCSYSPVTLALAAASSSPPCPSVSFPPPWAGTAVLLLKAQRIPHPDLDGSPGSLAAQRQALQGEGGPQQCPLCSGVRREQTSGKQVLLPCAPASPALFHSAGAMCNARSWVVLPACAQWFIPPCCLCCSVFSYGWI